MGALYATDRPPIGPRRGILKLEATGLVAALGYLAVADPHDRAVAMPPCPIKRATGWDCPSCGGLRMVHDLLHGELRRAMADNLYLMLLSPVLLYLLYRHARAVRAGEPYEVPTGLARGLLITAIGWAIVRNLPGRPGKPAPAQPAQLERTAPMMARIPAASPR